VARFACQLIRRMSNLHYTEYVASTSISMWTAAQILFGVAGIVRENGKLRIRLYDHHVTVLQFLPEIHMAPCKLPYCISHPAESPGASNSASAKVCTRLDRLISTLSSLQDCFLSDKMRWNYFTFFMKGFFSERDEIILHSKVHYKSILQEDPQRK
jgi:hypothetical protein